MMNKNHYYFLLPSSPWPVLISILSFNLLFSMLLMFKHNNWLCLYTSIFLIFLSSMFWWFSYSGEMNLEGLNSLNLDSGVKFAMILFISSEVFFFFSFFWSYFHFFLSPSLELGLNWPPIGILGFDCLNVPLINTLVLMGSGVTVTLSHNFLIFNKKPGFNFFLLSTILLGVFFTLLQILEYKSSFFSISDGSFGTIFFMLTGFHGLHVLIGTIFLLVCLTRSFKFAGANSSFSSFELASWYWHFVDVVWIFLYFFLYYLNQ